MEKFDYFINWFETVTGSSRNFEKIDSNFTLDMFLVRVKHKNGDEYFQIYQKSMLNGCEVARISNTGLSIYSINENSGRIRRWYDSVMEKYNLQENLNNNLHIINEISFDRQKLISTRSNYQN